MLNTLHIENIAVIEQAEIFFNKGLNVLTGETGAGKSIVIDAISAILGERTYRDLIRTGCDRASVTAVFSDIAELPWFSEKQIPYDPAELLIQREIHTDGRNVCRVNGRPVTVSILRELGIHLINIHGQNDTQTLFDEDTHLGYLDMVAEHGDAFTAYQEAYGEYLAAYQQVKSLTMDESERLRKIEMLQYQIAEIEKAQLQAGEDEELESRRRILRNAEKLSGGLSEALMCLYGSESGRGALDHVSLAKKELSHLASVDERYEKLAEMLSEAAYALSDVVEEIRSDLDDISYSGNELEHIESRLDQISRLKKKYGASVEEILEFCEKANEELGEIEFADVRLEQAREALAKKTDIAREMALILRESRVLAAQSLQTRIENELNQLDMPNIRFCAEFEQTELQPEGMDFVRFLMSANAGESLKPMSKVASGGELARIMLAMKNVLAEKDNVPTLIFDEVDAGVSGRAAQKVAAKLVSVSKGKQVFCVTHLPQIAAAADYHLLISKAVRNGRTYTSVEKLDKEGRVDELSRIIGGSEITENTRKSAAEMLRKETV